MKATAEKSSSTTSKTATQTVHQPFFARVGEGGFFAPITGSAVPPVQLKMAVNKPGDRFEQEADRMADRVLRMPAATLPLKDEKLQRQTGDKFQKKEDDGIQKAPAPEERLQRKGDGVPAVAASTQSAIQQHTTEGQPLSTDVRSYMEPRFGADFSNVHIHSDPEAASLSNQLSARAFTHQNHIFFSRDQYQPGTSEGKHLLAHELTHTIQQGHGVQRKAMAPSTLDQEPMAPAFQKAPVAVGEQAVVSSEVVDMSSGTFNPSERVRGEIEAQGSKGLTTRVAARGVAGEGLVTIRVDRSKMYDSVGKKGSMPLLNAWAQPLGGMHLNFTVKNNEIAGGYASLKPGGGDPNDWLQAVKKNSGLLGGLGLKVENLPTPVNKFENGKLTLGVTNLKVEVGGFLDAKFNVLIENTNKPRIDAAADINIKGMAKGSLSLDNTQEKLAGQVSLGIDVKAFSGSAVVKYAADGTVDVGGKAAYNANKLSGEIQFVVTDLEAANSFSKDAIAAAGGKENVQNAPPPAPVPLPKSGRKQRALAATGQLSFNLTQWFAGTVNVVVDGKGAVTVIGKIAPPAEIKLFGEQPFEKELVKFEAKAYYGIPVVGNLNLFANISLIALAKLGPAKIYNIEILGTYSTDPEVQKSIQISGSINISAYAGLRLRAEGGAGIEIVSHDLKFGIGLNADVGLKAYAEARPTVGYREPGEFYISGTLEMVAQPMLGLGGDFFIELETPWWSPLSDDKWIWPLFSKEWPLTDPIGINASVKDYVLGSGKVPEVELKKPEFDPSKFMTNMVDRTLPDKSGGQGAGQGTFKEDGTVPKPVVQPKKPEPKKAEAKPGRKGPAPKAGKSGSPDPKAAKDQASTKVLQAAAKPLAVLKGKGPLTRADLNQELTKIKGQVSGIDFGVQQKGTKWVVSPKAGGKTGKPLELEATLLGPKDDKSEKNHENTSASVKAKVKTELSGKTIKDRQEENALIAQIFSRFRPEGLKGIRFEPNKKKSGSIDVIVSASLAEKVANLDMSKPEGIQELSSIAAKMEGYAKRTTIYVFYDSDHKQFGRPISQKHGKFGHAEMWLFLEFPKLMQRIRKDRKTGQLLTPLGQPVNVHLDINRTPCEGCAESHIQNMVSDTVKNYADVSIKLTISSTSIAKGAQLTTEKGLLALLKTGVELTSSTVWMEIKRQMLANGIKQIEYGRKVYDIDDVNEFIAHEKDVQELIDRAVERYKRSIPEPVVKGSGVQG